MPRSTTPGMRVGAGLCAVALVTAMVPARAGSTLRCESPGYRYQYCRASTDNRVRLVRQISNARCTRGSSWGYDRWGIWVDRGCAAEFETGRSDDHDDRKAVAIGAAVVGLAVVAAIAANKASDSADVASWAVGTFSGYDASERADVTLTILPGGSVSGRAGRTGFSGRFDAPRLEAGRMAFRVERSGNGFVATDEQDASHVVVFRRTASGGGSGY